MIFFVAHISGNKIVFLATATETFEKGMVCLKQAIGLQIF